MNRVAVESSTVAEVGYDPRTATLEVAFHSGGVYRYLQVPESVFAGLVSATSVGRYLDAHVKKAGYRYTKVQG